MDVKKIILTLLVIFVVIVNLSLTKYRGSLKTEIIDTSNCQKKLKSTPVRECQILMSVAEAFIFNNVSALKELKEEIESTTRPMPAAIKTKLVSQIDYLSAISNYEMENIEHSTAEAVWKLHRESLADRVS